MKHSDDLRLSMYQISIQLDAPLEADQVSAIHACLSEREGGFLSLSLMSDGGVQKLICLYEEEISFEHVRRSLNTLHPDLIAKKAVCETEIFAQDENWLERFYRENPPFHAGSFWVYGSHVTDPVPQGSVPLQIDAVQAFGSGSHGTTHGCLEILSSLKEQDQSFQHILDVGTGSGILAIAAQKLFPQAKLFASDNDPLCVDATRRHADLNTVSLEEIILCAGFDSRHIQKAAPFDLIIANILPHVLIGFADELTQYLSEAGQIILSGIPADRADDVLDAYGAFTLHQKRVREDWVSLHLQRI